MELKFSDIDYLCQILRDILDNNLTPDTDNNRITDIIEQEFKEQVITISNRPVDMNSQSDKLTKALKIINYDKCPKCGGFMFPNHRIDELFYETHLYGDPRIYYDECKECGYEKYD